MKNTSEVTRRLKDARACLTSARKNLPLEEHRVVVQNAQLCIELSAKAVIAYFAEPLWSHDPSNQLLSILEERKGEIEDKFGEALLKGLYELASNAEEAAPWHVWSTYGKEAENGAPISAVELCTKEAARDLLERATRCLGVADRFFESLQADLQSNLYRL